MGNKQGKQMAPLRSNRFVNSAVSELQESNRTPIYGYQHLPLLPLKQAVKRIIPIVPGLMDYVAQAKENCNQNLALLTWDESAAIYLYSMPIPFFSQLNIALRAENRHELKPWFAFLKLFMTALEKLPSLHITVWRGVLSDVGAAFVDNHRETWWSVNSCSRALNVVELYLGKTGTVFAIDAIHGKDISVYSVFTDEQEVILMPGTCVRVKSKSLNFEDRLFIVHMEEEEDRKPMAIVTATSQEEIRVVLIGKTGNGKSSTGNSLLHSRSAFHSEQSAESFTRNCETKWNICTDINGQEKKLIVVDTPGFFDTNPMITNQTVQETIASQIFNMTSPGIHAFLIIVRVDRFTPEEKDTVDIIKAIFGSGAVRYCIVVFTREDQLDEGQTIDKFINSSASLQNLIHNCGNRRFAINNKLNGLPLKQKTKELLQMIDRLVAENNGNYYTNAEYQQIEKQREEEQTRQEKREQNRKKASEEALIAQVRAEERRKAQSHEQEIREDERRKVEKRIQESGKHELNGFRHERKGVQSSIQRPRQLAQTLKSADSAQNNNLSNNFDNYTRNGFSRNNMMPMTSNTNTMQSPPQTNTIEYITASRNVSNRHLVSNNGDNGDRLFSMEPSNERNRANPTKYPSKSVSNASRQTSNYENYI